MSTKNTTVKSEHRYDGDGDDSVHSHTIAVVGEAEMRVPPDLVVVSVTVSSRDERSSRAAQSANAEKAVRVLEALKRTATIVILRSEPALYAVNREHEHGE